MSEPIILGKAMPVKGMRELVYAVLKSDDETGVTYDTVKKVPGTMSLNLVPQSNEQKSYGDDGTYCIVNANGEIEMTGEMNEIPPVMEVDWFGRKMDANGAVVKNKSDKPNYIALGFRAAKAEGGDKLVWVYKCKPSAPEEKYETQKGGDVTIQTRSIKLTGVARDYDGNTHISLDSDSEGLAAEVVTDWTKEVYNPKTTA